MTLTATTQKYRKKTLLCVDDDPIIREICTCALNNYNIVQAEDGLVALNLLEIQQFDLVLSDVMMPNLNGLQLLQKIKEQHPDQAVILMTGYSDKELILKALQAGADDFINKPINILQLHTTVDKVLEKQKIRQELAELKQIDQLKSNFLGLISHKLKTPATTISLFIQNLVNGIEHPSDTNFKQVLSMVQAETVHLEQLIQDLLYFSEATLQGKSLPLEPIDLALLLDETISTIQTKVQQRQIDFVNSIKPPLPPIALRLNREKISFALRALLDNAIKFTPKGGLITITGELTTEQVKLAIRNSGTAIPQQELAKIFNKFYQVDPDHTGQVRGFGLGLYYSRDFIRSMGGQLYIESQPEDGTVATIVFPLPG